MLVNLFVFFIFHFQSALVSKVSTFIMSSLILDPNAREITCGRNQTGKSRKRTRNPEKHKSYQQKIIVQKGIEHMTKTKVVQGKIFHGQNECGCRKECANKINVMRQKEIFETFYDFKNWSQKTMYLRSLIKSVPKEEDLNPVTRVEKRTKHNYYLISSNGEHEEVCYQFFLNCLKVSKSSLSRAIKSVVTNESAVESRGRFPARKTKISDIKFVKKFIQGFPCYHSHYGPKKSNKKFLNPNLNIRRLYREYSIVRDFKGRNKVSEWKFRHIFNTKFNLGFRPKKVDTCRRCDKFIAEIQCERTNTIRKEIAIQQKKDHLLTVERTKSLFLDSVKFCREIDDDTEIFTFDLQRALELPSISTSEAFYRRQLWCYNLGIVDQKRNRAFMYIWDESVASRGAQEITSCLLKHFKNCVPMNTKTIIVNSDACPGQNRNIKTTLMLKKCLDSWPNENLQSIEQRFFVSGHSYNSCDRCFGLIEKQKKITEAIYTPQHWVNIIAQAKKNEPKFTVIKMEKKDFFSCEQLENAITNRKVTTSKEKVEWLNIQKIINIRTNPFDITVERYGSSPLPLVHVSLRKRGSIGRLTTSFSNYNFVPLYREQRPIKYKKYVDLMKLIQYIPEKFHAFYHGLKHDNQNERQKKCAKPLVYSSDEQFD